MFVYIFGTGYQLQMLGLNPTKQKSNTDEDPKFPSAYDYNNSSFYILWNPSQHFQKTSEQLKWNTCWVCTPHILIAIFLFWIQLSRKQQVPPPHEELCFLPSNLRSGLKSNFWQRGQSLCDESLYEVKWARVSAELSAHFTGSGTFESHSGQIIQKTQTFYGSLSRWIRSYSASRSAGRVWRTTNGTANNEP